MPTNTEHLAYKLPTVFPSTLQLQHARFPITLYHPSLFSCIHSAPHLQAINSTSFSTTAAACKIPHYSIIRHPFPAYTVRLTYKLSTVLPSALQLQHARFPITLYHPSPFSCIHSAPHLQAINRTSFSSTAAACKIPHHSLSSVTLFLHTQCASLTSYQQYFLQLYSGSMQDSPLLSIIRHSFPAYTVRLTYKISTELPSALQLQHARFPITLSSVTLFLHTQCASLTSYQQYFLQLYSCSMQDSPLLSIIRHSFPAYTVRLTCKLSTVLPSALQLQHARFPITLYHPSPFSCIHITTHLQTTNSTSSSSTAAADKIPHHSLSSVTLFLHTQCPSLAIYQQYFLQLYSCSMQDSPLLSIIRHPFPAYTVRLTYKLSTVLPSALQLQHARFPITLYHPSLFSCIHSAPHLQAINSTSFSSTAAACKIPHYSLSSVTLFLHTHNDSLTNHQQYFFQLYSCSR